MMLEASESLLPIVQGDEKLLLIPVSFSQESMDEFQFLLSTLRVDCLVPQIWIPKKVHPGTYLGQGKVLELKQLVETEEAHGVAVDVDLTPSQMKNLEKAIGRPVLDRSGVILEIFSRNARTNEAKTQVALARLQYLKSRLTHFWSHFERQRGGAAGNRGMGEKQLEVDRRLVEEKVERLKIQLEKIRKNRMVQRAGRENVLKVALVGYTNAGKSTLLNALTHSAVKAENRLFSTLDSTIRALDPHSHPPIVAIDTVGFISRVPAHLIASFRSTLEELADADLLLHVVDASSPFAKQQVTATLETLEELGLEAKERLVVLNKTDLLEPAARNQAKLISPGAQWASAVDQKSVSELRDVILNWFRRKMEPWDVLIPYGESRLEAQIHQLGHVEKKDYLEKGVFYRVRIHPAWAYRIRLERFRL